MKNSHYLPPSDIKTEEAVLGLILTDRNYAETIFGLIEAKVFYDNKYRKIFKIMSLMYNKNIEINILTFKNTMGNDFDELGGEQLLVHLLNSAPFTLNVEQYCQILNEKYKYRLVFEFCSTGVMLASQSKEDIDTILTLPNFQEDNSHFYNLKDPETYEGFLQDVLYGEAQISTGYSTLDKYAKFQLKEYVMIAGASGMGKTAFTLDMIIKMNQPTLFFSLEMSRNEIIKRIVSKELKIEQDAFGNISPEGKRTPTENVIVSGLLSCADRLNSMNIIIDDNSDISVSQIEQRASEMKRKHDIKVIVIDHKGLVNNNGLGDREIEKEKSRRFKNLAKKLNVVVIALVQINKLGRDIKKKEPVINDLNYDNGQDANKVLMIYRPHFYSENGDYLKYHLKVLIRKNRSGKLGSVDMFADMRYSFIDAFYPRSTGYYSKEELREIESTTKKEDTSSDASDSDQDIDFF